MTDEIDILSHLKEKEKKEQEKANNNEESTIYDAPELIQWGKGNSLIDVIKNRIEILEFFNLKKGYLSENEKNKLLKCKMDIKYYWKITDIIAFDEQTRIKIMKILHLTEEDQEKALIEAHSEEDQAKLKWMKERIPELKMKLASGIKGKEYSNVLEDLNETKLAYTTLLNQPSERQ
jgi:hypothetical protein